MKNNRSKLIKVVAVGLMALLVGSIQPAGAYPPGEALTVTFNRNQVMIGQDVKVRVTNPAPGNLEVTFGNVGKVANVAVGVESVVFTFKPSQRAVYSVVATDAIGDKAYGKVYVPYAIAPKFATVGKSFIVRVSRAKPGSPVAVYFNNRTYVSTVRADGTTKLSIKVKRPLTEVMRIAVGKTITNRWIRIR